MLVLTREKGEVIRIGADIILTVVAIGHNRVRIGIEAPLEVPVHRQEVYDCIQAGKRAAED